MSELPKESVEERVAYAIWLSDSGGPADAYDFHKERDDAVHRRFLGLARAALRVVDPVIRKQRDDELVQRLIALHNGTAPDRDERYQMAWRAGVAAAQDAIREDSDA